MQTVDAYTLLYILPSGDCLSRRVQHMHARKQDGDLTTARRRDPLFVVSG